MARGRHFRVNPLPERRCPVLSLRSSRLWSKPKPKSNRKAQCSTGGRSVEPIGWLRYPSSVVKRLSSNASQKAKPIEDRGSEERRGSQRSPPGRRNALRAGQPAQASTVSKVEAAVHRSFSMINESLTMTDRQEGEGETDNQRQTENEGERERPVGRR
ncbi:unnamed protein product [Soboliphyme baturini]|uniref:Uncharacterized protein n=1 Tax=Soboliphyme baturini TaxID=241478 RepID=A0A183IPQ7_9BILA|nr:unnamed protein product [Soboliphyme baturini]